MVSLALGMIDATGGLIALVCTLLFLGYAVLAGPPGLGPRGRILTGLSVASIAVLVLDSLFVFAFSHVALQVSAGSIALALGNVVVCVAAIAAPE
jgi:hypothetical protein